MDKSPLKSKKFIEAKVLILEALEKYPNHINLLTIASDIYRAVGNREKSMEYAELLITHHPKVGKGYLRATEDLIALKRFEEALIKIKSLGKLLFLYSNFISLDFSVITFPILSIA